MSTTSEKAFSRRLLSNEPEGLAFSDLELAVEAAEVVIARRLMTALARQGQLVTLEQARDLVGAKVPADVTTAVRRDYLAQLNARRSFVPSSTMTVFGESIRPVRPASVSDAPSSAIGKLNQLASDLEDIAAKEEELAKLEDSKEVHSEAFARAASAYARAARMVRGLLS